MILKIPNLKARFAAKDKPSAKDMSDLIDSVIASAQENITAEVILAVQAAIAALPTGAQIVVQPTPPNISYMGGLWMQTDPVNGAMIRVYNLNSLPGGDNNWHSRHPINPGTIVAITDATFDPSTLPVYDGGGTPGSGAMWVLASDLAGKFILGVDGSHAINTTGGELTHVLSIAELPAHTHIMNFTINGRQSGGNGPEITSGVATGGDSFTFNKPTLSTGSNTAHNNMPPYKTAYFIRRTTRTDYILAPGI